MTVNELISEAAALARASRLSDARPLLAQALEAEPNNPRALYWSGVCALALGEAATAARRLEAARAAAPGDANTYLKLGEAYLALSRAADAKAAFEKGLAIDGTNAELAFYLGRFAEQRGDLQRAEAFYRRAADCKPPLKQAFLPLAEVLHRQAKQYDALHALAEGEAAFPDERDFTFTRGRLAATVAPLWHLPMLADAARNDAYEAAIRMQVKPGDIVLDIGTGSGLLAMMAARAGADHVYACEANPVLARLAEEIVERNGFADRITVIAKHSSAITVGGDMPVKADVLVTEVFDNALVGEGVLPTMAHAHASLLKPGARVIPQGATLYAALTASPHLQRFNTAGDVSGFDLAPMHMLAHPLSYKDAEADFAASEGNAIMSEPFQLAAFDFGTSPPLVFDGNATAAVTATGEIDSILLWFDLNLAPGIVFSTQTTEARQHWRQVSQTLLRALPCRKGDRAGISVRFNRYFDFSVALESR